MKIVAFLSCQWFKPESVERIKRIYDGTMPEIRAKLNARYLFYKSLSGKRLKAAFGDLCDIIVWEECTKEIATVSSGSFPPDYIHIGNVISHFAPKTVLTFGAIATKAINQFYDPDISVRPTIISGPHPAARHSTVVKELAEMAARVRALRDPHAAVSIA